MSLYKQLLPGHFDTLPPALRTFHERKDAAVYGALNVGYGPTQAARLRLAFWVLASEMRSPASPDQEPVDHGSTKAP